MPKTKTLTPEQDKKLEDIIKATVMAVDAAFGRVVDENKEALRAFLLEVEGAAADIDVQKEATSAALVAFGAVYTAALSRVGAANVETLMTVLDAVGNLARNIRFSDEVMPKARA